MDVTKMLEADHRQVESLFDRIEAAEGAERQSLVEELDTSLRGHMELEEKVVYRAMEPVTGAEEVQEGNTEHDLARDNLAAVVALSPDGPGFGGALDALIGGITHHVGEEEDEVFPKLRSDGADILAAMATPFLRQRSQLGLPVDADALSETASKDELVAEAESAGIDGASSMTKAELAEQLVTEMQTR